MRRALTILAAILPLAGCYVAPGGYGQPAYPYGAQADYYPGYDYNGGAPYMAYEGSQVPLIFVGGFWGYHDREGHFRRAPAGVERHLESRHPRGEGARSYGGQAYAPVSHNGNAPSSYGGARPQTHQNAAAPVARSAPAAQGGSAPRQEDRRGDRRCPHGENRC